MFYDSAPKLVAAVIILCIPATITFALRCYVRLTSAKWGWDDWMMSASMVLFLHLALRLLPQPLTDPAILFLAHDLRIDIRQRRARSIR